LCKFRRVAPGLHQFGPAYEREYQKLTDEGCDEIEAAGLTLERLQERSRARMEEARSHKKSQVKRWTEDAKRARQVSGQKPADWSGKPPRPGTPANRRRKNRKRDRAPLDTPAPEPKSDAFQPVAPYEPDPTGENLRAAQEEAESRPMTDLERACYEGTPEDRLAGLATAWTS
jgi:hypothetical protein